MQEALEQAGFGEVSVQMLPLTFRAPAGRFAENFKAFAARAAVILDRQDDAVLQEIYKSWDAQLSEFLVEGHYEVPMPALAVSAVRED